VGATTGACRKACWTGIRTVPISDSAITDLSIKERALARTTPTSSKPGRYQPPDSLLAFLESL
jgi:hypothetical protein